MGLFGDKLTKSAGTAFNGLALSTVSAQDNFLHYNSFISNGDFEGGDVGGLANGWQSTSGTPSIKTGNINGRSQRITATGSTVDLYKDIILLPNPKNEYVYFSFKLLTNSNSGTIIVSEETGHHTIYTSALSDIVGIVTIEKIFKVKDITRLLFYCSGMQVNDYIEIDDVILKSLNQDNLIYTI